ncbi:MAG: hypothetical protein F7C32_01085 [Desulfurococcales archaeon]|nr:hypothetical protein [Desulfurococcales archaeon]
MDVENGEDKVEVRSTIWVLLVYAGLFILFWIVLFRELLVRGVISGGG